MNRFLAVIPGASVGPKQSSYNSGISDKVPGQLKGKLLTGNRNVRTDAVAQTAAVAVCGSCLDAWKEPRTSEPEDRATGRPAGLATLFIHAKHHFLTLEFTQNGANQAAVFEIGKAMPLTLLPVLEAKTGKKVEYQSKKK
ncbi:MAG: hypothetical protein P8Z30_10655 [Acidobacteriota bacterium]